MDVRCVTCGATDPPDATYFSAPGAIYHPAAEDPALWCGPVMRPRPCTLDASLSGVDLADPADPAKVWRCDGCGAEGTTTELDRHHLDAGAP